MFGGRLGGSEEAARIQASKLKPKGENIYYECVEILS